MLDLNLAPFIIVLIFIFLDIVSGVIKGFATKDIDSTKMKSGLWSKSGTILLELLALICSEIPDFISGLPAELELIYLGMTVYIVSMEIISIIENICIANPSLSISKILEMYGFGTKDKEENDDKEIS